MHVSSLFAAILGLSAATIGVCELNPLVEAHLAATGGRHSLMTLEAITRSGEIEFFGQTPEEINGIYSYKTELVYPIMIREQIKGSFILLDRGSNGLSHWEWNGMQYESISNKDKQTYLIDTALKANRELLWVDEDISDLKLISTPPDWVDSRDNCLSGEHRALAPQNYLICFDSTTHLLSAKGTAEEFRRYSDWRFIGPIKIPFIQTHFVDGAKKYEIRLNSATAEGPIDYANFEFPGVKATHKIPE